MFFSEKDDGNFPRVAATFLFLLQLQIYESFGQSESGCGSDRCSTGKTTEQVNSSRETTKAIIGVMSVSVLLIICLIVLLIIICAKKRSWAYGDQPTASNVTQRASSTDNLSQIENGPVEVPSYILHRQMSLISTYSGPPPYFSIFKIIVPETGEVRSSSIGQVNTSYETSVENTEEQLPDYRVLFESLPNYEEAFHGNRKA